MLIMNRGEIICQEEMEPGLRARERAREEERADALAQRVLNNTMSTESDASAAPDAEACKAVALAVALRVRILQLHKKRRLNGNAQCCRQGLNMSMVN